MNSNDTNGTNDEPAWNAVYALSLGVAALTAVEMLPVSLLTPMATDLHVSAGLAGQMVTATAVVGFGASLFTAVAARRMDRRRLLLLFSLLQVASGVLAALAPNLATLLVARMLLGLALGGFWAMAAAVAMRLVPAALLPRALAIILSGVSVATVAAAPIGVFLAGVVGWHGVFMAAATLAGIGLIWQALTLPSMPPQGVARLATLLYVLRRPRLKLGLLAVTLVFSGHFAFFTYLRPFLENVTAVDVDGITLILLAFGIANFAGTSLSGRMLASNMWLTLLSMAALMIAVAAGLVVFGGHVVVCVLVALWGFAFGTVPVSWSTWIARAAPDEAESSGGILVAAIQAAMMLGAAAGGVLFNAGGAVAPFIGSGVTLLAAVVIVSIALKPAASSRFPAASH